jgi:hypothetical protein
MTILEPSVWILTTDACTVVLVSNDRILIICYIIYNIFKDICYGHNKISLATNEYAFTDLGT